MTRLRLTRCLKADILATEATDVCNRDESHAPRLREPRAHTIRSTSGDAEGWPETSSRPGASFCLDRLQAQLQRRRSREGLLRFKSTCGKGDRRPVAGSYDALCKQDHRRQNRCTADGKLPLTCYAGGYHQPPLHRFNAAHASSPHSEMSAPRVVALFAVAGRRSPRQRVHWRTRAAASASVTITQLVCEHHCLWTLKPRR